MTTGLALNWSLKKNLIIKKFHKAPFSKNGLLNQKAIDAYWDKCQKEYQIKANSGEDHARALSGGNQQKVILARELDDHPEMVIANQPTRGLDIGASEYVRQKILDARNDGAAVLLVSADLEEILQLSDRIAPTASARTIVSTAITNCLILLMIFEFMPFPPVCVPSSAYRSYLYRCLPEGYPLFCRHR